MSFRRFVKACRKYKFSYALSTYCYPTLVLRPDNTFENIELKYSYTDYRLMFKEAVQKMKEYRASHDHY